MQIDKGTETAVMATMHCFLRDKEGDLDKVEQRVIYGPSTENKIERWWRELHVRLVRFYKEQLNNLLEYGSYNPTNEDDRCCTHLTEHCCTLNFLCYRCGAD